MFFCYNVLFSVLFLVSSPSVNGLSVPEPDVVIQGPDRALASGDAVLECYFPNPRKLVNRLVWWKDGEMIFTYSSSSPSSQDPIPQEEKRISEGAGDISIDPTKSDGRRLHLRNVTPEASGNYQCDLFNGTVRARSRLFQMEVLVGPKSNPQLKGFPTAISADEILNGNCTIPLPSNETWAKATQLKFLINDKPVQGTYSVNTSTIKASRNRAQLLTAAFTLAVQSDHFQDVPDQGRQFTLTCVVTVQNFANSLQESKVIYDGEDVMNRMRVSKRRTTTTTSSPPTVDAIDNTNPENPTETAEAPSSSGAATFQAPAFYTNLNRVLQGLVSELENQNKIQQNRLELEQKSLDLKREELDFVKSLRRAPIKTT